MLDFELLAEEWDFLSFGSLGPSIASVGELAERTFMAHLNCVLGVKDTIEAQT